MLIDLYRTLFVPFFTKRYSRRVGLKLIKLGTFLAFDNKRGSRKLDPQFDSDVEKLKNGINRETYVGAYSENGGHSLVDNKPICTFSTISVLNVLRDPESVFGPDLPNKLTKTENEHKETW